MYPVQPYFALSTTQYHKRLVNKDGIAHIYEYHSENALGESLIAIPDGSIDFFIDIDSPMSTAYAAGSVRKGTIIDSEKGHTYFGVRFLPGFIPPFIQGKLGDFVDSEVDLLLCTDITDPLISGLTRRQTFHERADFFISFYKNILHSFEMKKSKEIDLCTDIRKIIETNNGCIKVSEIAQELCYSERYINKIFSSENGFSPKFYCRVIRFQNTIDAIDHDAKNALTMISLDHGYFDQSQFIKEFKEFTLIAPNKYRNAIKESNYLSKFVLE